MCYHRGYYLITVCVRLVTNPLVEAVSDSTLVLDLAAAPGQKDLSTSGEIPIVSQLPKFELLPPAKWSI